METIRIAHLYYDLMNLYGEHGNILALRHHLEEHKIHVIVHYFSIDDEIDFSKYDFFYIGSGNQDAFEMARKDILKHKKEWEKVFKNGTFLLATGNAINLFGKCFHTLEENEEETLNLLSFEAWETDFRIVGEQTYTASFLKEEIIGFQNRNSVLKFVKEPHLFEVKEGTGYVPKAIVEGIHQKNFFGTYLLGPILIRNPYFTEYLIKEFLKQKEIPYKEYKEPNEIKAYEESSRENF